MNKLEHGTYFVSVPTRERNTDGVVITKLVGLPAILQRRRTEEVERETEKMVVATKLNRRGKEVQKATRERIKESHDVCDVLVLLHDVTPEQSLGAEVAGLTQHLGKASTHTGVYECSEPEANCFKSDSPPKTPAKKGTTWKPELKPEPKADPASVSEAAKAVADRMRADRERGERESEKRHDVPPTPPTKPPAF